MLKALDVFGSVLLVTFNICICSLLIYVDYNYMTSGSYEVAIIFASVLNDVISPLYNIGCLLGKV